MHIKLRPLAFRELIEDTIQNGITGGLRRAYKHTSDPAEDDVIQMVLQYVMNALDEIVEFPEDICE